MSLKLFTLTSEAKTDSTRRGTSLQSLFGKSSAAQTAEQLRASLLLALGFCAINTPGPMLLQEKARLFKAI